MKVVILAGGFGTRISEESRLVPKPMVTIGDRPILCHIMSWYSQFGFNEFIICAGYKQDVIKEYFFNYYLHNSDITFDLSTNAMQAHSSHSEPWKVSVIDTGLSTMTGGRIKQVKDYIGDETFMLTYGDGVADIDIPALVKFHKQSGKIVTLSSYNAGQQFGVLEIGDNNLVSGFREKDSSDGTLVNIGYMICEPKVFDYIEGDNTVFEKGPLETLAREGELDNCTHSGFWQCMDTLRDKERLEKLWNDCTAPWKVWSE